MKPSVSAMHAMVEAVPITMQVPEVGISWSWARSRSGPSSVPARIVRPQPPAVGAGAEPRALVLAGEHRADVDDDRRHVGGDRAHQLGGNGLVAAADQHHGVERQRRDHLLDVHRHQVSQQHRGRERERLVQRDGRETRTAARRPCRTPRATASATCGAVLWQGLKSEAVERMPTIGRSSASSVKPAPLRKPRRRNSANSSSPYWARRDRRPFFMTIPQSDRTGVAAIAQSKAPGCQRKRGGPPGGGRNRAGRSNGAGKGASHADPKCSAAEGDGRRMAIGRGGVAKGSMLFTGRYSRLSSAAKAGDPANTVLFVPLQRLR